LDTTFGFKAKKSPELTTNKAWYSDWRCRSEIHRPPKTLDLTNDNSISSDRRRRSCSCDGFRPIDRGEVF